VIKTLLVSAIALVAALPATAQVAPIAPVAPVAPAAKIQTRADIAAHISEMFAQMDANHDGFIARSEIDAGMERRDHAQSGGSEHGHGMRLGGRMFDMADANRDGRISLQEATDAANRHFDMADLNHDGQLTPDERMEMHQRWGGERPHG
jgi:hypothetical protein